MRWYLEFGRGEVVGDCMKATLPQAPLFISRGGDDAFCCSCGKKFFKKTHFAMDD
jgi:hypothetical protein